VPPQTGGGAGLVQSLTVVNRHSLVGALPAVAAGQRREELARRAGEWRLRVAAGAAT